MATSIQTSGLHRLNSGGSHVYHDVEGVTGTVWFVNSSTGSDTNSGFLPSVPFATLAAAITAASAGDKIVLLPGWNEGLSNAQITISKALTIEGKGSGSRTPRLDFDHANASIDITANGVTIRNLRLLPSVTAVAIGIDVTAGVTDTTLEDIEILPGEDGAGTDEMTLGIDIKAGCTRTTIRRLKVRQHASAANVSAAISLTGASDDILIEDCDIVVTGGEAVAPIKGITTLSTNVRIKRCILVSDGEPGIELLTGTTGVIQKCLIFSDLATVAAAIVADGCALDDNMYIEVGGESGAVIGTPSAND